MKDENEIQAQINEMKQYFDNKEPHTPFCGTSIVEGTTQIRKVDEKLLERKGSKKRRLTNFTRESLLRSTSIDKAVVDNIMQNNKMAHRKIIVNAIQNRVANVPSKSEESTPSLPSLIITLVVMILSLII